MGGTADLEALGWNEHVGALLHDAGGSGDLPGRVVRVERDRCRVSGAVTSWSARAAQLPAVGDWVAVRTDGTEALVTAVAPRTSVLTRRDPSGLTQVLAANVDLVFVAAPADRLRPSRVQREVALAWDSGARPVVVLTKSDLDDGSLAERLEQSLMGVEVVAASARSGAGITDLRARLRPARTAVLIGPSGAGKSSVANALLGSELLATGEVRAKDRRGRHTTTSRDLRVVPSGGCLIDTPGLRSLSLPGDCGGVEATFPEVDAAACGCRFSDCSHSTEPGCAVVVAAADGRIDPDRLANYRKLLAELRVEARRDDPLARRLERSRGRSNARALRQLYLSRRRVDP